MKPAKLNIIPVALILLLSAPTAVQAAAPRNASSIGNAGAALGDQNERLRQAHVKQLALGDEAEQMYVYFEALALEAVGADAKIMQEIFDSSEKSFKLEPNRAEEAREAVEYYTQTFSLTRSLAEQEQLLDTLGDPELAGKEKKKEIKKQLSRTEKSRKKVKNLRQKIKDRIKSALEYDEDGTQRQALENWLVVSAGMLRDLRLEKEKKIEQKPAK